MAQTTVIRQLGRFSLSLHVVGAGIVAKPLVSHFEWGRGQGTWWAGKTPLRLAFRARKGCGGGSGVGRGCCLYKKDLKKWWISKKPRRNKKKNARFERGCEAGDVAVKEKSWSNVEVRSCSKVLFKLRITWLICHLFFRSTSTTFKLFTLDYIMMYWSGNNEATTTTHTTTYNTWKNGQGAWYGPKRCQRMCRSGPR